MEMSRGALLFVLSILCSWMSFASAQDLPPGSESLERVKIRSTIQPAGPEPFGERVNLYTGELSFHQTDVQLEGTGPTITLSRSLGSRLILTPGFSFFGNWTFDIPRIETLVRRPTRQTDGTPGGNWTVETAQYGSTLNRCSQLALPYDPNAVQDLWWHGYDLVMPGGARQTVLKASPSLPMPSLSVDGSNVVFTGTTQSNWRIGCLPGTSNGQEGEAFLAVDPQGTKYFLDHLVGMRTTSIVENEGGVNIFHPRMHVAMMVSRIEDRFGNFVTFTYDGPRVTGVSASDGRQVQVNWSATADLVTSIVVQPSITPQRTTSYIYSGSVLTSVVLPDGSRWTFDNLPWHSGLAAKDKCTDRNIDPATPNVIASVGTVTSPSGLTGKFTIKGTYHARSYVGSYCINDPGLPVREWNAPIFSTGSITEKEISGPGISPQTWRYTYGPVIASTTSDPCAQAANCVETSWVDSIAPDGSRTRYTFSNRYNEMEGKLLSTAVYEAGSSTPIQSITNSYASATAGPYPSVVGGSMVLGEYNYLLERSIVPLKSRTIVQQGDSHVWSVASGCTGVPLCFDAFGRPLKVNRSSGASGGVSDTTAYHDDTSLWVIGQIQRRTTNNIEVEKTDFGWKALPWKRYAFGKLAQTLSYSLTNGTLATSVDGNGHATSFSSWKRGIPQLIVHPVQAGQPPENETAQVNDYGDVTWVKDENGYQTTYTYDLMGRVVRIKYPATSPAWLDTVIDFAPAPQMYGLPANHWQRWVTTGNRQEVTYYDAMWRPVIEERYDVANPAATRSITVKRYDSNGRQVFQSFPLQSLSNFASVIQGATTTYDALGRAKKVAVPSEDSVTGSFDTTTSYLSNGDGPYTLVTDPKGNQTRTWFQAFDQPSYDAPVEMWLPENAYVDIERDAFGKPLSMTRRNIDSTVASSRYWVYDGNQRLCQTIEPETGTTLYDYDDAGNLTKTQYALPSSLVMCGPNQGFATNDAAPTGGDLPPDGSHYALRTYDPRNRVESLVFSDHRGDTSYSYTKDGLLEAIDTSDDGVNHVITSYTYNTRRFPALETLQVGGYSWPLQYGYDTTGNLASNTYPDGLVITYGPNALGQPSRAGTYATGVSYFPNGATKGFTYGNGIVHSLEQNDRQMPERSVDSGGVLNDSYDYDGNGNVKAISDGRSGARGNRDMGYDGLDRLTSATSKMFGNTGALATASYTYDVLDNLKTVNMPATPFALARSWLYCYDAREQLTFVRTATNCSTGAAAIALSYDLQGNLANKNNQLFEFDHGNRLREMQLTGSSGPLETYAYDGHGRRVMTAHATKGTIWSMYSQDGALRYQRNERTAKEVSYVSLNGSLVARVSDIVTPGRPVLSVPSYVESGTYTVSWTGVASATSYTLQEKQGSGAWSSGQTISATSKAMSGKTPGATYTYKVQACSAAGCGHWSNEGIVTVASLPASIPILTVPTDSTGIYSVSWTAVTGAQSYILEESTNGGPWEVEHDGTLQAKQFIKNAGDYSYRIKACNPAGCTAASLPKTVHVTRPPEGTPALTVPATSLTGSYSASWTAVSTATSYKLEEKVGSTWVQVQKTSARSKAFSGVATGSYSYRVSACNSAGCGPLSATKSIAVTRPPTSAPALTVPATNFTGSYAVSWTAVATTTTYKLEEKVGSSWAQIQKTSARSKTLSGKPTGSYSYRVSACNDAGCGPVSVAKSVAVTRPPSTPPTTLTGYKEVDGSERPPLYDYYVSWSAVSGATRYELQEDSLSGTQVHSTPLTSFATSGRGARTYTVRACNDAGCSVWRTPSLTL